MSAVDAGNDPGGDADFRAIRAHAAAADPATARAELEGFLHHHPYHPQRPFAVSMLAAVLLGQGDGVAAQRLLDENGSLLAEPERSLLRGLCESRLGHHSKALTLLRPYIQADPPRMPGLPDSLLRSLLRLSLADALADSSDPAGAMDQLELYANVDGSRDAERTFATVRATEIATTVKSDAALQALSVRRGVFARAALGAKAAAALRAQGNEAGAVKMDQETLLARRQIGLEPSPASSVPADPTRLGFVAPFSGPQARLGEVVLRGAMLVVSPGQPGSTFHLLGRDAAATPDRSTSGGGVIGGVASLTREDKVIGVVSTPDSRSVDLATREAVPLLLLDERVPGGQTTAFPVIHSSEARAVSLARKALALGAHTFAILGPDTPLGKRLATAYRKAAEEGGGSVAGHITYAASATSFTAAVAGLRKLSFDALFVPDDASHLELVAPALAVADIWPRSPRAIIAGGRTASAGRREILLESTALSLSPKLLHNAERYVQGALLCPGFYPADDSRSVAFVNRFRDTYGTLPSASDAYGYDAFFVLRSAIERGARTRADVLRLLASQTFEGLTGNVRFGADHGRVDPPLVYVVDGDSIRVLK